MPGPLWGALAINAAIILLIFALRAEWDAPRPEEYFHFRDIRRVRPFILRGTKQAFLLVPADGDENVIHWLETVVLLLRLRQPRELAQPMPLDAIDADLARRLNRLSGGATAYHFYRLPRRKERLLERYLRRLALGDAIYAPPSLPAQGAARGQPSQPPASGDDTSMRKADR